MNEQTITVCGFSVEIELASEDSGEAAAAAEHQARAFLKRVDALPGEPPDADPDYFHMYEPVSKPSGSSYELYIENFEHVPAGTAYANVDGEDLIAEEPFWPIMMSEHGFEDIFGYKGHKIAESIEEVKQTWFSEDREQRHSE